MDMVPKGFFRTYKYHPSPSLLVILLQTTTHPSSSFFASPCNLKLGFGGLFFSSSKAFIFSPLSALGVIVCSRVIIIAKEMSTAVSMSVSNELQGIGSILGSSENQRSKTAASLRRTLSADMSSKKWLSKNGFCPLKRIASSEELKVVTDEEDEDDDQDQRRNKFQNWSSVPFDDKVKKEKEPPGETDIWSSIVLQKSSSLPTPYVHPLAKRSRSLSQQSLEICTENLGSETGSDGFSSPPSETSDEEQEEEEKEIASICKQDIGFPVHNSFPIKKSPPRSFPPPLPSLSQSGLHMRSHRIDGRLVLQAVPVPSHNYFQAQREGGRLLLTLANPKPNVHNSNEDNCNGIPEEEEVIFQEDEVGYEQEEADSDGEDYDEEEEFEDSEEEEEENERGIVLEMKGSESTKNVPTGVINVHRSALMVNKLKLMGLTNIDPSWSPKLEKMVDVDDQTTLVQSLPPPLVNRRRLIPTTASSFNTYDYCWRTKSAVMPPSPTVCAHPLTQHPPPINKNNKYLLSRNLSPQEQQEVVLMRGNKADYLVPFFHGCKEPRRSPYVWEPHCIAT